MMSEAKRILLVGAGGHCQSVLDSLISNDEYSDIGIVDNQKDGNLMGVPIVGADADLPDLLHSGYSNAFITVGSVGNVSVRKRLYKLLKEIGFDIPNIIDSTSIVSKYAVLGEGNYIGKKAVINSGSKVGNCSIINTASIVEHGCRIEDFVHIAPGSVICGDTTIGVDSHIGAGAVVRQGIRIGSGCMIGMGSVVTRDIRDDVIAYGNPCKEHTSDCQR